jgi:hypothetical protein
MIKAVFEKCRYLTKEKNMEKTNPLSVCGNIAETTTFIETLKRVIFYNKLIIVTPQGMSFGRELKEYKDVTDTTTGLIIVTGQVVEVNA